ncbi:DNA-directed RNA polymerase subunit H, partial [Candidatus Woesearchaeota archaeon CG10_big_fil_rev_8_21_14_0_10_30_7]
GQYALKDLPKILVDDPMIQLLNAKDGDVIKIERNSLTAGKTIFYRRVVNA